jgi:hypothetical protein
MERESRKDNKITDREKSGNGMVWWGIKIRCIFNLHRLSVLRTGFLLVNIIIIVKNLITNHAVNYRCHCILCS